MYRDSDQTRDVKSTARMFVQLLQKFLKESLMSFHDRRAMQCYNSRSSTRKLAFQ